QDLVEDLRANGGTNYEDALNEAMDAWGDPGKLVGDNVQNVSYFFSDGEPVNGDVERDQQGDWEEFLSHNGINSYAIGLGPDPKKSNLNPIAHDPANPDGSDRTNTIVVEDLNELDGIVQDTIVAPVSGDLVASGDIGADVNGAHIASITI